MHEFHGSQNLPQDALDASQGEIRLSTQFLMNTRNLIEVLFKEFSNDEQVLLVAALDNWQRGGLERCEQPRETGTVRAYLEIEEVIQAKDVFDIVRVVLLQQLQQFDFVQTLIEKVFAVFDDLTQSASGY
jgi:hypothetical protein